MVTLLVTIRVINFIQWKKVFDNNESLRKQYHINMVSVYANINDVDKIVIHLEAQNIEEFEEFTKKLPRESVDISDDALLEPMKVDFLNKIS